MDACKKCKSLNIREATEEELYFVKNDYIYDITAYKCKNCNYIWGWGWM